MAASEELAATPRKEVWVIDKRFFYSVDEVTFMEEIKKYPTLYSHTLNGHKTVAKVLAIRKIAKKFQGSTIMVNTRYSSIRTKIGRYLKRYRPADCFDDNFDVCTTFKPFSWIFRYIRTRWKPSELVDRQSVSKSSISSDKVSLPNQNLSHLSHSDDNSSGLHVERVGAVSPQKTRVTPRHKKAKDAERVGAVSPRKTRVTPRHKKAKDAVADGTNSRSTGRSMQRLVVDLLQQRKADNDSVMLFLRSIAPRIREIPTSRQLQLQCELLQVIDHHCKLESGQLTREPVAVKSSPKTSPSLSTAQLSPSLQCESAVESAALQYKHAAVTFNSATALSLPS